MSGKSGETAREKWDRIYRAAAAAAGNPPEAARVLAENVHLLPVRGAALDVACGLGGNALCLARRRLDTLALDISPVAVAQVVDCAARLGLPLRAEVRDVVAEPPAPAGFDVIVVGRFLERALAPALIAALRPGGLLFYQTFTLDRLSPGGPSNPAYLLRPRELLELFGALDLVVYREEGRLGDLGRGFRDEALLVGRKP